MSSFLTLLAAREKKHHSGQQMNFGRCMQRVKTRNNMLRFKMYNNLQKENATSLVIPALGSSRLKVCNVRCELRSNSHP